MEITQTIGSLNRNRKFWYNDAWHTKLSSKDMEFVAETTMGPLRANEPVVVNVRNPRKNREPRAVQGPDFLQRYPRHLWERYFAYSIKVGSMKKCCNSGCILCEFTGWVGKISPGYADYSTTEGDRTLQRWCDAGKIRCFRINKRRLIC